MSPNISIIFVPGTWHTEFHVRPFVDSMAKLGYRVVPVIPETNRRLVWLEENIKVILQAITTEIASGHQVCVVGHSISGISVVLALSRFLASATVAQKSHVVQVVFIACFFDYVALRARQERGFSEIDFDTGVPGLGVARITRPPEEVFYNDMPVANAAPFVAKLAMSVIQAPPVDLLEQVKMVRAGIERICYFVCRKDMSIPTDFQRKEVEEAGFEAIEMDSGHCPMVSQPQRLAEEFQRLLLVVAA